MIEWWLNLLEAFSKCAEPYHLFHRYEHGTGGKTMAGEKQHIESRHQGR